ncbi:MAG: cellulose-binding protein CttA-related protein [Ruminococcus sp.]|nr:cellulose-binding protein CttA-related protein [Ruminococcus sp.]
MLERYRTMKNSLFKRAIAAAATVPLALTQCPTFTNAVSINAVKGTAQVQAEEGVTLEDILYIPAGQTVSNWNKKLTQAMASQGEKTGTVNIEELSQRIINNAGQYKDVAEYALDLLKNVTYKLDENLDLTIEGEVAEPDFNEIIKTEMDSSSSSSEATPGRQMAPKVAEGFDLSLLPEGVDVEDLKKLDLTTIADETRKELAEKYDIPEIATAKTIGEIKLDGKNIDNETIKNISQDYVSIKFDGIDFSKTKIGGKFKLVINGSDLKAGTTVTADFTYECNDGNTYYLGQLPEFAKNSLEAIKKTGDEGIKNSIDESVATAIQDKFDHKLNKLIKVASKADNGITRLLNAGQHSKTFASVPDAIAYTNDRITSNKYYKKAEINKQLPAKATDIAANSLVLKYYEKAMEATDNKFSITANELGQFVDSLMNVKVDTDGAKGTVVAIFPDSEKETKELQEYLAQKGYVLENSYKKLTAKGDLTNVKTEKFGSADIQLERVMQTNTTTTTTSTTTTTTTTTTSGTDTDTDTDTNTTTTTTTPTTTTEPVVTTTVLGAYLEAQVEQYSFYYSIEEAFDKSQITNAKIHGKYQEGYKQEDGTVKITGEKENAVVDADMDLISFGTATPANTYDKTSKTYKYEIPVYYNGEPVVDSVGEPFTMKVYIGVKGDTNLDGIADAVDASLVLRYYAQLSTGKKPEDVTLSNNAILQGNPSSSYDDLAAFLSDVQTAGATAVTRFTRKINRTCDAVDSSRILKFYAKRSSADYESMTNKQIWDIVDKIAPDPNANKEAQEKAQDEA